VYRLDGICKKLLSLLESYDKGRIIREGINTVITGRPNVGKSTLLNMLSGRCRAIVTEIPGTTRDVIEEYINIHGVALRLIDTAGIRDTDNFVEKIGIDLAKKELRGAELVLFVIDAGDGICAGDYELFDEIGKLTAKCIVILNKVDLVNEKEGNRLKEIIQNKGYMVIPSILDGNYRGKAEFMRESARLKLETAIADMFLHGEIDLNNETIITNARHKDLLQKALSEAEAVLEICKKDSLTITLDCISIDIMSILSYLGRITGEEVSGELLDEIFSKFCIGK